MKENMKSILSWLAIVVLGYLLISVLISMGIFNLYHIQIIETIDVFPVPLAPIKVTTSPWLTSNETSFTA